MVRELADALGFWPGPILTGAPHNYSGVWFANWPRTVAAPKSKGVSPTTIRKCGRPSRRR